MSHTPTTQRVITCQFVVYGTDFLIIRIYAMKIITSILRIIRKLVLLQTF